MLNNTFYYNLDNENILRKVTVKIGLERIDIQKGITVKMLLDNRVIKLVISLKFTRKQGFKLKKIERLIYMRNMNSFFNKKNLLNSVMIQRL